MLSIKNKLLDLVFIKMWPDCVQEYKFDKKRKWRFDYAWPNKLLALEIEGGHWIQGRHNRGTGFEKDMEKYNEAALAGWRVLRVTSQMMKDGTAFNLVRRAIG